MAFSTASLPSNGKTTHFAVSYDDSLSQADGLDMAKGLLSACENDLALIQNWFTGVGFQFNFPINVQITGDSGGASWMDPADITRWFGFSPTVSIKPGPNPSVGLIRYLLVSEVTEMFMASQQKDWFEGTSWFYGANEGSMGESLSRFLAAEFLTIAGINGAVFPGYQVAYLWLNDPSRPNYVDNAPDDIQPDSVTGCGICFIFYLNDQLQYSIQQIIAASASTLGGVYTNLTGKTDGWASFKNLVDLHYPLSGGRTYFPPLDNVFPVADLSNFVAPVILSWVENNNPNNAGLILSHSIKVDVDVAVSSDVPATIGLPLKISLNSSSIVRLTVPAQSSSFTTKDVTLTASYAGTTMTRKVKVVRPENLPVPPLVIKLVGADESNPDPCTPRFIQGGQESFYVSNIDVIQDRSSLTYKWTVSGAGAPVTNTPILVIPALPRAGIMVAIKVEVRNALGIHSTGNFEFTTAGVTDLHAQLAVLQCRIAHIKAINRRIPPWVPIEAIRGEQIVNIEKQAHLLIAVANRVIESVKALRASQKQRQESI